jgi:hypothetical protein
MAKTQAGLLSLGTTGKFAGSMVFAQTASGTIIRQLVVPTNPKTQAQTGTRSMMQWISREWAQLTAPEQATWLDAITKAGESPFNAFVRAGMVQWSNGLFAQSEFPSIAEIAPAIPTTPGAVVNGRQVTITWVDPAARVFGVAIHVNDGSAPALSQATAVKVVDEGVQQAVLTFTEPGTKHYRIRAASHEGIFGPATADATFVIS